MIDLRRELLILACAVSAGIHAGLTPEHFDERFAAGLGFAASAVALAILAVGLARRLDAWLIDASVVVLLGLIGAYLLAVTTGIPGLVPEAEPVEWLALVTKAVEVVGVAAGLSLRVARIPRLRPLPIAVVAVVIGLSAVGAAAASRGDHGHGHDHAHHEHHHG